jgi:hypothetical protein
MLRHRGAAKSIMKRLALLVAVLGFCLAAYAEPTAADQKWLEAVQKMVIAGQTKVSTPSQERVTMLKNWAGGQGYSVEVVKTDAGYRVDLTKHLARK